jgi:hypothetical protein
MSLEDVQQEVAENKEYERVLFEAGRASQLVFAIHQLTILRNRPIPTMAEEQLAQRRALLDITIKITKMELKVVTRELVNALEKWELR